MQSSPLRHLSARQARMFAVLVPLFTVAACADDATSPDKSASLAALPTPTAAVVSGMNMIAIKGDPTKCISVRGGNAVVGATTELARCDSSPTQQFAMHSNGEIRLANAALCLEAFGGDGNDGDRIGLAECTNRSNQIWSYSTTTSQIRGINRKCIDSHSGTSLGTKIHLWSCHDGSNQKWSFNPVTSSPPPADTTKPTEPPPTEPPPTEPPPPSGPLPVFPGAAGFGTATTAGRGGAVLRVTNLNNDGAGSLRAALQASGARTIIFDVSGTITLSSKITVNNPNVTVAGQTAPAPGVLVRGAGITIRTHDVLVQHIRVRPGDIDGVDAVQILGPAYNVVIDHVSASWATDEILSTWYAGARDITVSNAIISEGLNLSNHSKGVLIGDGTVNFAMVGSLVAHHQDRHPYMKGGTRAVFANNVIYNWGGGEASYWGDPEGSGPAQGAVVGNVYKRGPATDAGKPIRVTSSVKSGTQVFVADNSDNGGLPPSDQWSLLVRNDFGSSVRASTPPLWPSNFTAIPNGQVYESVLSRAGAWPASRDAVDQRVVGEVRSGTGRIPVRTGDVGGYPSMPSASRALALPANYNADDDRDGYTNLEELLHQLARAAEGR